MTSRKRLLGALVAIGLALGVIGVVRVQGVAIQCGGSFVTNTNCIIQGFWNFTNTAAGVGKTYPSPFQVGGTDVTGIISKETTLSNAQVLALNTTPITVVPAPGAGYYVDVIAVSLAFNYAGAYTVNSGDDLRLYYTSRAAGTAASSVIETNGFLTSTADIIIRVLGVPDNTNPPTTNAPVVLADTTITAFGGGNAGNSLKVIVNYRIVATGL